MKLTVWAVGAAVLATLAIAISSSATQGQSAKIAHGKYIVEAVAICGDCHTPRNEKGEPLPGRTLTGTALSFKPLAPVPVWADKAPNIAGLRGWDNDAAVKFLMTGIAYNDLPGRPPMPQYRMNLQDAEAVVAYLKSLATADK
jgi:mono/diheme cytochrome c family protein